MDLTKIPRYRSNKPAGVSDTPTIPSEARLVEDVTTTGQTFRVSVVELPESEVSEYPEVHALQIRELGHYHVGLWHLGFAEFDKPVAHTSIWYDRHQPCSGGYYVIHADGYISFATAQVFEAEYSRI